MTDKEIVKETLKEIYPQYSGFIEHTLVAEMCLKYHEKQCHIADVTGQSEQLKALLEKLLINNMCSVVGDELIEEALKGF